MTDGNRATEKNYFSEGIIHTGFTCYILAFWSIFIFCYVSKHVCKLFSGYSYPLIMARLGETVS